MSGASVRSFDAIQRIREELHKFSQRAGEGLDGLDSEIRHVIDWVEHDRPGYWKERVRRAYDAKAEAVNELQRCLMYPINDEQPACSEERDALKKAAAHLDYCEDKQRRVRQWAQTLRHELHEYQGRTSKLKHVVEIDTTQSTALLARALEALERYSQSALSTPNGPAEKDPPNDSGKSASDPNGEVT